jgi:uncharacterized membrane protein YdjX (TVP38/TMEM64 family)
MKEFLTTLLNIIEGLDPLLAPVMFIAAYVAATILFIPGLLLTMAAGLLFGLWKGTLLVSLGSVLGAALAFLLGRTVARDRIAKKINQNPRFQAIDEAIGREGAKIVFLLRLSPLFPFNFLNYALGLTRVKFWPYVFVSWIGMLPATVLYVYLGSLAGDLSSLAAGNQEKSPLEWAALAVGLVMTLIVTFYVTKIARAALRRAESSSRKSEVGSQ